MSRQGSEMHRFLGRQNHLFQPDVVLILVAALEKAWRTAQDSNVLKGALSEHPDARELLALEIIALAKDGERDPVRLCDDALKHLAKKIVSRAAH